MCSSDLAPGPTPFSVNALVLADLARSRHRSAIERLDRELERRLDPGPHLSVDRDRFYRTLAAAVAGWADPATADELDHTYRRALDAGDDWTVGWMGWGAGAHAARIGRIVSSDQVIAAAPDIIVGSWCGKPVRREKIAARAGWDQIPAVRHGQIHEIKSAYILQPGPAALTEGVKQLQAIVTGWVGDR